MARKRCYDTLVGASVGWNQIDPIPASSISNTADGITFTDNRDGSYTFYTDANGATADHVFNILGISDAVIRGHVYAITGAPAGQSATTYLITDKYNGVLNYAFKQANICKPATSGQQATARLDKRLSVKSGCVVTTPITFYLNSFDLTQMFGSTIADYLYNLETATAGSGIAKLRSWGFLRGYQAYNAGTIESVEVTGKKVVGFNQWDEVWELGGYANATGAPWNTNTRIRSKTDHYIPMLPNTNYFFKTPLPINVYWYDADKNYIGTDGGYSPNTVHMTPSNAYYMRFALYAGTTYNHDICISLSSDRNGEYEPYHSASYPLGSDTLRGIFKLDANNRLYADGDRKEADGTVTRKYGIVDLGTLNWTYDTTYADFSAPVVTGMVQPIVIAIPNAISAKYTAIAYDRNTTNDKVIMIGRTGVNYIRIKDSAYTDAVAFKNSLSNVMLVYELATPTTEQSTPFVSAQTVYPDGTEEYVTGNGVPVGHETRYQL